MRQVDMVPPQPPGNHHGAATAPSMRGYPDASSLQEKSLSSSVGVEVNGDSVRYPSGQIMHSAVVSQPLQPLIETQQETSPTDGTNRVIGSESGKKHDLELPDLSPQASSSVQQALAAGTKTPERQGVSTPRSGGSFARAREAFLSTTPSTPMGRTGPHTMKTSSNVGSPFLSPPRLSARLQQQTPPKVAHSPDPVFCAKSLTSPSVTSPSMNHSIMSANSITSPYSGTGNFLEQMQSFDSSIRSRVSHGTAPSLQAVPEGGTVGDSSYMTTDDQGSEEAVLGMMQNSPLKVSPESSCNPAAEPMPTDVTMPGSGRQEGNHEYGHSTTQMHPSAPLGYQESAQPITAPKISSTPEKKFGAGGRRVERLAKRWQNEASAAAAPAVSRTLNFDTAVNQTAETQTPVSTKNITANKWQNERGVTRAGCAATPTATPTRNVPLSKQGVRTSSKKPSSVLAAISLFEKKTTRSEQPHPPPMRGSSAKPGRPSPIRGSLRRSPTRAPFDFPNQGSPTKPGRPSPNRASPRRSPTRAPFEVDNEEVSVSLRSLMSAYESAASGIHEEDEDDSASVKSLRDKFEGAAPAVESEVQQKLSIFETKTNPASKPFQKGPVELQQVFSKFQSKKKAKLFTQPAEIQQTGNEAEIKGDESEEETKELPRPDTGHVSVLARARGFAALASNAESSSRSKSRKPSIKSGQTIRANRTTHHRSNGKPKSPENGKFAGPDQTSPRIEMVKPASLHEDVGLLAHFRSSRSDGIDSAEKSQERPASPSFDESRSSDTKELGSDDARLGISPSPLINRPAIEVGSVQPSLMLPPMLHMPEPPTTIANHGESSNNRFAQAAKTAKGSPGGPRATRLASVKMVAQIPEIRSSPQPDRDTLAANIIPAIEENAGPTSFEAPDATADDDFYVKPIKLRPGLKKRALAAQRRFQPPTLSVLGSNTKKHGVNDFSAASVNFSSKSSEQKRPLRRLPTQLSHSETRAQSQGHHDPSKPLNTTSGEGHRIRYPTPESVPTANPLILAPPKHDTAPTSEAQKVLLRNTVGTGKPMKTHERKPSESSGSEFSDGVTLDVSIADVSGLTMPTDFGNKTDDTSTLPDSPQSQSSQKSGNDAQRSQATSQSSNLTPEILAPLMESAMRASDESTLGESFFNARAAVAQKRAEAWDLQPDDKSTLSPSLLETVVEKKSSGGLWDDDEPLLFPRTEIASSHNFNSNPHSEAVSHDERSFPDIGMPMEAAERELGGNRLLPNPKTPTRHSRGDSPLLSTTPTRTRTHSAGPASTGSFMHFSGEKEVQPLRPSYPKTPTRQQPDAKRGFDYEAVTPTNSDVGVDFRSNSLMLQMSSQSHGFSEAKTPTISNRHTRSLTPSREQNQDDVKTPTTSNRRPTTGGLNGDLVNTFGSTPIKSHTVSLESWRKAGAGADFKDGQIQAPGVLLTKSSITGEPRLMLSPGSSTGSKRESADIKAMEDLGIPQPNLFAQSNVPYSSNDMLSPARNASRTPIIQHRYGQRKRDPKSSVVGQTTRQTTESDSGNSAIRNRLSLVKEARRRRAAKLYQRQT